MQRQISLDIFRGLTLAAMLLVNNPGSWSSVYAPLLHSEWHGLTPTDLVFPFFMFIVGAALFHSMKNVSPETIPWEKITKRTVLLFIVGFLLNIFPFNAPIEDWRILGVLQRIAICYGITAVLICIFDKKQLIIISALILVGYWLLLLIADDPYSLEGNLVRKIDLLLFAESHLYHGFGVAFDPEGLLSCLPGVATVLAGYFTSDMLEKKVTAQERVNGLLIWGVGALAITVVWQLWFPINKPLWTSTYVLVSSACAWFILAVIIYIYDIKKYQKGFHWLQVYGSNPLFIYALSRIFSKILSLISWTNDAGEKIDLHKAIYIQFTSFLSPINASLLYALMIVGFFYLISAWLFKRKIFIKL